MAFTFNGIDLASSCGLLPGQISGGNIALQGCFDMPARIGDVSHEWGDEDGAEIYTDADELFFGGRDITFEGLIIGDRPAVYSAMESIASALTTPSGVAVLSTPYGDFNVYPKMSEPQHFRDISKLKIEFREPVPDLSGGTVPGTSSDPYTIDGVPMSSFGLYAVTYSNIVGLAEMKEQKFTKIESEGYQIAKRRPLKIEFSGLLLADNLTDFKANIKNLYALFSSEGERTFVFRNQVTIVGVPLEGFKVEKVLVANNGVAATLKTNITVISIA